MITMTIGLQKVCSPSLPLPHPMLWGHSHFPFIFWIQQPYFHWLPNLPLPGARFPDTLWQVSWSTSLLSCLFSWSCALPLLLLVPSYLYVPRSYIPLFCLYMYISFLVILWLISADQNHAYLTTWQTCEKQGIHHLFWKGHYIDDEMTLKRILFLLNRRLIIMLVVNLQWCVLVYVRTIRLLLLFTSRYIIEQLWYS